MYLGGLTQIVGEAGFEDLQFDPGEAILAPVVLEGEALFVGTGFAQHTALFDINNTTDTGDAIKYRTNLGTSSDYPNPGGNDLSDVGDLTLENLDNLYSSVAEYLTPDSPTLDDDSDGTSTYAGFDISSTESIDQEIFTWNPQVSRVDSDNLQLLDSDGISQLPVGDSDDEITLREVLDRGY
jgi:hypothetical protein